MTAKKLIKLLKDDGWQQEKQGATAHKQFSHPEKAGKITVSDHGKTDIPPGTLNAILKQAGLK